MIDPALTGAPLLEAARSLLIDELLPALPDRQRHAALMLANALAVATRALRLGDGAEREEQAGLERLLANATPQGALHRGRLQGANRLLCERIRGGHADEGPWRSEVLAHLQATCQRQLEVSNPKALAPVAAHRSETP